MSDITTALTKNMEATKKKVQSDIAREMSKRGLLNSSSYSDTMAAKLTDLMARHNIDVAQIGQQEKRYKAAQDRQEKEDARNNRNQIVNTLLNTAVNVGFLAGGIPGMLGKKEKGKAVTPTKSTGDIGKLTMGKISALSGNKNPTTIELMTMEEMIKQGFSPAAIKKKLGMI